MLSSLMKAYQGSRICIQKIHPFYYAIYLINKKHLDRMQCLAKIDIFFAPLAAFGPFALIAPLDGRFL